MTSCFFWIHPVQPMVWVVGLGPGGFGILRVPWKSNNPFHEGIPGIQTTNPNQQLTISWSVALAGQYWGWFPRDGNPLGARGDFPQTKTERMLNEIGNTFLLFCLLYRPGLMSQWNICIPKNPEFWKCQVLLQWNSLRWVTSFVIGVLAQPWEGWALLLIPLVLWQGSDESRKCKILFFHILAVFLPLCLFN